MSFSFTLAGRYLMGRKLRTFLTTLAVIFGVMIVFGLNGLIPAFTDTFRQNMMAAAFQVDMTITSASRGPFPSSTVETVHQTSEVAAATGLLVRNIALPAGQVLNDRSGGEAVKALSVTGVDPVTARGVRPLRIELGRSLEPGDDRAALIPADLAGKTGLDVGDTLSLPAAEGVMTVHIVGVFTNRAVPGSAEEIYVPLTTAQALFNLPGQINTIEVLFKSGVDQTAVQTSVLDRLGPAFKAGSVEAGSELLAAIEMGQVIMNLFGFMALIMGGFIILITFRTLVTERRRDIGMLRALGASRKTVLRLILVESLIQGVLGTAIGLIGGYLLVKAILWITAPVLEMKMNFPIGEPRFSTAMLITAIVLGIGITLAGGLFPALSAARLTPLEALRPASAEAVNKSSRRGAIVGAVVIALAVLGLVSGSVGLASLGAFLFLAGLMLVGPALVHPIAVVFGRLLGAVFAREGQIAQGNLTRQPGRAAVTASVMTIGLAIVVALAGMITSLYAGVFSYLDKSLGADYLVMPHSLLLTGGNVGAGPDLAREIAAVPGVEAVSTIRMSASQVGDAALQVVGIDPATYPQVSGLVFSSGEPEEAYAALSSGRAMIANGIFITQIGAKVGDELTLQTPEGPQTYRIVAVGLDYLNAKLPTAYISQAYLEQDFHETSDLLLMANGSPDADAAALRTTLSGLVGPYSALKLYTAVELRNDMLVTANSSFSMLYLLMVTLAAPSLIALVNTLAINVLERTREIGMLRAVGATRRQVSRMILAESLLLAGMGTAFGILAGLWLGYVLIAAANGTGFVFSYYFPFGGILLTIAIGLIFAVLAALLPARQAARLEIVSALHYE